MARLFGLIGNRADLAGRVLELEREALRVPPGVFSGGPLSWGIGFYQGGDVLLRRRLAGRRSRAVSPCELARSGAV
jgi:glutamine amidotransferase